MTRSVGEIDNICRKSSYKINKSHGATYMAVLLAVEAVVSYIEEEAGQNEVQQVHVLAAQAPVVTHPGCPLQTFAALMMLTMEYRMEQRL